MGYLRTAKQSLRQLFIKSGIDAGHGYDHALAVMHHARHALKHFSNLNQAQRQAVLLAALLHDADDGKFFPNNKNYENATEILQAYSEEERTLALQMIGLVSCSRNGNQTSQDIPLWMFIPRWCDRLEAMGEIGIKRCQIYNEHVKRPIYIPNATPVACNIIELECIATNERFQRYQSGVPSVSMIDHFYDKLLHLRIITGIPYIDEMMETRHKIMVDYVIDFWRVTTITQD
jgi:uncharacterized protein